MKTGRISSGVVMLLFVLVIWVSPQTKSSRQPKPAKNARVFVLGSFHMANPGRDMFNLQVDDVLAPKRQKELSQLAEILKKFKPTKVAIESQGDRRPKQYEEYLAGRLTLTQNEIHQVGFRVAKESGHKQIYPIDIDGDFPFEPIKQFAKKNGKEDALNSLMSRIPKDLEVMSGILKRGTVIDLLRYVNADNHVEQDQRWYMSLADFAGKGEYPGGDLLTAWYQRNIRIYTNLRQIIDSPDERVLVIYGSGHLYWLRRNILDSPDLELVRLSDYVK